mgnify:CR=1 FL=1
MKVVHLNTSDFGGAAMAAIQLHQALLDQGVESDLLTLNKTRNDIQRHHRVAPFSLFAIPLAARVTYKARRLIEVVGLVPVSYTHLRAHETVLDLVCRLLLEKNNNYIAYAV